MKKILVSLFIGLGLLVFGDNSKFELFANNIGYIEEVKKYDNSNGTTDFEEISERDLNRNYLFRYYLEQTKYNVYKKVTEEK